MPSVFFYLGSFLFLFFSRKQEKRRSDIRVQQTAEELLEAMEQALNLKVAGIELRDSKEIQKHLVLQNNRLTLQQWVDISAFVLLLHWCRSVAIADKLSFVVTRYHFLIVGAVIYLLVTGKVMFEYTFAMLLVFFSALLLSIAILHMTVSLSKLKSVFIAAEIPSNLIYRVYLYYAFKMLQAPGSAIQWVIDLFRPDTSSQSASESQK